MFFNLLIQVPQTGREIAQNTYLYLSIFSIILVILGAVWRISVVFGKKADKEEVDRLLGEKADGEDLQRMEKNLNSFIRQHEGSHDRFTENFLREMEKSNVRQQEINKDILSRLEETIQNQQRFNDDLGSKMGEMIPKIAAIEANMAMLVEDFRNRTKYKE